MPVCSQCQRRQFSSKAALRQHIQDSPDHQLFECSFCESNFYHDQGRQQHELSVHRKRFSNSRTLEQRPPCQGCGKLFGDENALQAHMKATHPKMFKRRQRAHAVAGALLVDISHGLTHAPESSSSSLGDVGTSLQSNIQDSTELQDVIDYLQPLAQIELPMTVSDQFSTVSEDREDCSQPPTECSLVLTEAGSSKSGDITADAAHLSDEISESYPFLDRTGAVSSEAAQPSMVQTPASVFEHSSPSFGPDRDPNVRGCPTPGEVYLPKVSPYPKFVLSNEDEAGLLPRHLGGGHSISNALSFSPRVPSASDEWPLHRKAEARRKLEADCSIERALSFSPRVLTPEPHDSPRIPEADKLDRRSNSNGISLHPLENTPSALMESCQSMESSSERVGHVHQAEGSDVIQSGLLSLSPSAESLRSYKALERESFLGHPQSEDFAVPMEFLQSSPARTFPELSGSVESYSSHDRSPAQTRAKVFSFGGCEPFPERFSSPSEKSLCCEFCGLLTCLQYGPLTCPRYGPDDSPSMPTINLECGSQSARSSSPHNPRCSSRQGGVAQCTSSFDTCASRHDKLAIPSPRASGADVSQASQLQGGPLEQHPKAESPHERKLSRTWSDTCEDGLATRLSPQTLVPLNNLNALNLSPSPARDILPQPHEDSDSPQGALSLGPERQISDSFSSCETSASSTYSFVRSRGCSPSSGRITTPSSPALSPSVSPHVPSLPRLPDVFPFVSPQCSRFPSNEAVTSTLDATTDTQVQEELQENVISPTLTRPVTPSHPLLKSEKPEFPIDVQSPWSPVGWEAPSSLPRAPREMMNLGRPALPQLTFGRTMHFTRRPVNALTTSTGAASNSLSLSSKAPPSKYFPRPMQAAPHAQPMQTALNLSLRKPSPTSTQSSASSESNSSSHDEGRGLRMHCRHCRSDPCHEPTATMCGHMFCYRCITDVVVATSRCPVCETPTLLYCLFRLHLEK